MTIGQLAKRAGVTVETIRFYERRGLLRDPRRGRSGYRRYTDHALSDVRFIRQARRLRFSLRDIAELMELRHRRGDACPQARKIAQRHLGVLEREVAELRAAKRSLTHLADACKRTRGSRACALLDLLECDRAA